MNLKLEYSANLCQVALLSSISVLRKNVYLFILVGKVYHNLLQGTINRIIILQG